MSNCITTVYAERFKIIKQYMQYHDIPPAKIKDNVSKVLATIFTVFIH